jgi:hypothetical protein
MNTLVMTAVLLTAPAPAPGDRFGQAPYTEVFPTGALRNESVRKEIKLDPEVARRALAIEDAALVVLRENDGEVALAAQYRALREIKALLSAAQRKRLEELYVQSAGVAVVLNPQMSDKLNLSDEQIEALRSLYRANDRLRNEARLRATKAAADRGGGGKLTPLSKKESAALAAERSELRSRADAEALKLLTRKQRAKLEAMKGEPFDPKKGSTPDQDGAVIKDPPK